MAGSEWEVSVNKVQCMCSSKAAIQNLGKKFEIILEMVNFSIKSQGLKLH